MAMRVGAHRWVQHLYLQGVYSRNVMDYLGNVGDIDGLEKYLVRPHTMNVLLCILEQPWISRRGLAAEIVDPDNEESEKRTLETRIRCLDAYRLIEIDVSTGKPCYRATRLARNTIEKIDKANLIPAILSLLKVMCSDSLTFKQTLLETQNIFTSGQNIVTREKLLDHRRAYRMLATVYSEGVAQEIDTKYPEESMSVRIRKKKIFRDQQLISALLLTAGLGAVTSRLIAHRIYGSMTSFESAQKIVARRIVTELEDEALIKVSRYRDIPVSERGKALVFDDPSKFRSEAVDQMHPCVEILDAGVELLTRSERDRLQPAAIQLMKSILSMANGNQSQRELQQLMARGVEEVMR